MLPKIDETANPRRSIESMNRGLMHLDSFTPPAKTQYVLQKSTDNPH
ncbi:MAG: hypothetical protein ACP6IP_04805 [Candidatus Njordarchaeia archaeon]